MSAKQFSFQNGMSHEQLKLIFGKHCLILGKAAFESHTNSNSTYVYKSQLQWDNIKQSSFGWLLTADYDKQNDAFQFVHDSIRQYLMAIWVAHTVRTQTDCTELLRVCAEKSAHLPITRFSLAHILKESNMVQFVTLLQQQTQGVNDFNNILLIVTTIAESKRIDALTSLTHKLFPDKTLDLCALPEISHHGLHCLTQLIKYTPLIQTIRLPENMSFKNASKQYPFGQKRLTGANHRNQIRYLSYLPLFESLSSASSGKPVFIEGICFAKTDQEINVEAIQQYLQFGHSLKKITLRSNKFKEGTLGDLSKSLLLTPNVTDVVIALTEVNGNEIEETLVVLSCLNKLENVEFTEYRSTATCCLSVSWGTFMLKWKTRQNMWQSVLSFRPSDIREIVLDGVKKRVSWWWNLNGRGPPPALSVSTAAMLAYSFPHMTHLVKLKFNHLKVSSSELSTLFQGLSSLPSTAESVDSSAADGSPPLEVLGCSDCDLTDLEILVLSELLKTFQNLKEVNLSHNKISNKGALMLLLERPRKLQVETENNDGISASLKSLLTRRTDASQVTKLDLTFGDFSWRDVPLPLPITAVHLLLQFLPQLPNLQDLALCVSCQGEEEAEHINQLYGVQHVLKKLKLKNWSLDNIIRLSTQMLQHLPLLKEIDLSHNAVSDEAAPGLAKGLGSCQNLKKVNLTHNKLSDRGDFLPPLPNLEEIDLSHNAISDEAVPGLVKALGSCQNLKHVNLKYNKISNKAALFLLLQDQCKQIQVEISGNNISDDLVSLISNRQNALQDLEEIDLSHNSICDKAVPGLVESLCLCQNLKKVNLCYNQLSDRGDFLPPLPNLEEIDLSNNVISDETVPGLAKGLGSCQNLKKVNLSHNYLSDRVDFLPPLPNLEEIDLSNNVISDETVPGLAKGLGSCQNLKKVNLSHNKLSDKGDFLPPLPNLEEIDLSHNVISDEAVPRLAEGLGSCQNLKKVNLSHNHLSDRGEFLPSLPNLEEIDLSHNGIRDEAVPGLATGLGSCQNLKKVNLSHNQLSDRGEFLPSLPNLEEIDLSHNAISDEAVSGLAEGLASCQKLKKVNLSHNKLSDRGDFLPPLPNLEEIDLSHNDISDEAVPGLAEGLGSCQKLKKVNLSHNKLSDRGDFLPPLPNLEEIDLSHNVISDKAVPGLAEGLASCQNLKKVSLSDNKLSDVRELTAAFTNLPFLTRVDMNNNSISDESLPTIAAWLKGRTDVKEVCLLGNRFSAEGVRNFVRTMKGKTYRLCIMGFLDVLLYDGSQAGVDNAVESGGEDERREERQWEELRRETGQIHVKVGQLWVWIDHKGSRSNNLQLMPS
ncbi:uncharacterized protein LOC144866178 [Branchiostoma floridae x Branchiostoma japonicum]